MGHGRGVAFIQGAERDLVQATLPRDFNRRDRFPRNGSCGYCRRRRWRTRTRQLHIRGHLRFRAVWDTGRTQPGAAVRISVDRRSDFRPYRSSSGLQQHHTVTIQISTLAISGFGCFNIPTSDFKVSSDLQSAALHKHDPAHGPPSGAGANGVSPFAGGGGGGGLPASLRLDVTWTGDGVVGTTHDQNSFQCAGYTLNRNLDGRAASVTASGTVSSPSTGTLLSLSPADQGVSLRKTNTNMNITGIELNACFDLPTA